MHTPIPSQHNDPFLLYLNTYIRSDIRYKDVYTNRTISSVTLDGNCAIIDFSDNVVLIIPDVYLKYLQQLENGSPTNVA